VNGITWRQLGIVFGLVVAIVAAALAWAENNDLSQQNAMRIAKVQEDHTKLIETLARLDERQANVVENQRRILTTLTEMDNRLRQIGVGFQR